MDELLVGLQQMHERSPQEELSVDLSELARIERPAGSLLASALIGALDDAAIRVTLPAGGSRDWLVASGLAFALANRSGETQLDGSLDLEGWSRPWRTGGSEGWRELTGQRESLFDADALGGALVKPDRFGSHFAAFVDAHLAPTSYAPDHPLIDLVWPWLDRLLPGGDPANEGRARNELIAAVGALISETVGNVRQHAGGGGRPLHSLVQLAVTRGGAGSHNRLHLTVLDNGRGIVSTARSKVNRLVNASLSDHQLLFKLCDGSLPPWGRGRGKGLPRIVGTTRALGGAVTIRTRTTRVQADGRESPLTAGDDVVRVDGTLVSVVLPLVS